MVFLSSSLERFYTRPENLTHPSSTLQHLYCVIPSPSRLFSLNIHDNVCFLASFEACSSPNPTWLWRSPWVLNDLLAHAARFKFLNSQELCNLFGLIPLLRAPIHPPLQREKNERLMIQNLKGKKDGFLHRQEKKRSIVNDFGAVVQRLPGDFMHKPPGGEVGRAGPALGGVHFLGR